MNVIMSGAAFATAVTLTNFSVAYGSLSGTRMIKSLEPAIVSGIQLLAGSDPRADLPWVALLAAAVSMLMVALPTGVTSTSALAALISTAAISTRNVFVKKHISMVDFALDDCIETKTQQTQSNGEIQYLSRLRHAWTSDIQTSLNFVATLILLAAVSGYLLFVERGSMRRVLSTLLTAHVFMACISFAVFQVGALMVLERVSPARQAAMKSLHNAMTTAWAIALDSRGKWSNSTELFPAIVWGVCVVALIMSAPLSVHTDKHASVSTDLKAHGVGNSRGSARFWQAVYVTCWTLLLVQCGGIVTDVFARSQSV